MLIRMCVHGNDIPEKSLRIPPVQNWSQYTLCSALNKEGSLGCFWAFPVLRTGAVSDSFPCFSFPDSSSIVWSSVSGVLEDLVVRRDTPPLVLVVCFNGPSPVSKRKAGRSSGGHWL